MPGAGSDATAVAGLLAAGVGLGGLMVTLGFVAGGGGRRMSKYDEEETDDEYDTEASKNSRAYQRRQARRTSKGTSSALVDRSIQNLGPEDLVGVGFSMEQAREMADAGHATAMKRTPVEVLGELQRGNVRFWTGQATRPERSAFERRALISKQFPSTAILSCSDSRVPIEIVFDQGLGDMFVIRVAGNCLDTSTTASLQYAVHHLKVKVLMVMGHEGCGAVKAAQLPLEAINKEPESLGTLLKGMRRGLETADISSIQDTKAADREAVTTNVKAQVEALTRDKGIMGKVRSGELFMVGSFYEISSGIVDFFHEVSGKEEEAGPGSPLGRKPSTGVLTRFST